LREARKNGDAEDAPSFTPQVNKRPSYLKQTDSLDKLTGANSTDPNDIFEQPLPGARAAQPAHVEYSKQNLPSPGSDALGREVKRFGQDDVKSNVPVYKSKFLQQYEQDNSQQDEYEAPLRGQPQAPRSNPPAQNRGYEYSSPARAEEPDEPFMNSLRGAGGSTGKKAPARAAGPGWNDDTTSGGFPAPVPVRKNSASKVRSKPSYESEYDEAPPTRVPVGGRRAQTQQKQPKGDWNMDTDVAYDAPPAALPPKVSPRLPAQQARAGRGDTAGAASQARPNLSLLKSKIRRSESGKNVLAMESHNSSAAFNGQSERDYGATTSEKVADIRNGGRRSAPNPSLPSESASAGRAPANRLSCTTQGQYRNGNGNNDGNGNGYDEQEEEQAYVPSQIVGRSKARPAAQPAPAQRPAFSVQYDEDEEDPYGADAYPPGHRAPARSQPPAQQPKFKPQPPAKNAADSRFDDDPYGPDAYPPGGYPPSQQSKPTVQKRAPADSRFDDDPYGPDAYPPGGYPPAQQSKAKVQPVAQARRLAADSRFDEDPYGADAYPPTRSQPAAQQKPKAQPAPQRRAAAPEPRYDDDPYGPDAYPPGGYPPAASAAPSEYPEESGETRECPHCSRNFNVGPFAKHIKICEKVFMKKRKVFDSTKMRLEGVDPELDKILAKAAKDAAKQAAIDKRNAAKTGNSQAFPGNKPQAAAAQSRNGGGGGGGGGDDGGAAAAAKAAKWKEDSNAFRNAMKAARQYTKAVAEGKPLPPPVASAPDASLILCNNCGRRFNQKAAERHIPQCKNIIAKPQALKRGAGGGGGVNGTAAVQAGSLGATKGKGRF